ncbi:helix-turn-helix domain-containing protein, partial [Dysosmobacter welbionis]
VSVVVFQVEDNSLDVFAGPRQQLPLVPRLHPLVDLLGDLHELRVFVRVPVVGPGAPVDLQELAQRRDLRRHDVLCDPDFLFQGVLHRHLFKNHVPF